MRDIIFENCRQTLEVEADIEGRTAELYLLLLVLVCVVCLLVIFFIIIEIKRHLIEPRLAPAIFIAYGYELVGNVYTPIEIGGIAVVSLRLAVFGHYDACV